MLQHLCGHDPRMGRESPHLFFSYLIGDYVGNSLANQRVILKTRFLKIILFSNDDNSQGWGYSISKIEHVPYGVLQVLFPPYKKGD